MSNKFVVKNGLSVQSGGINTTGDLSITGSLVVTGTLTAESYVVSSSVSHITTSFSSGSTQFGDTSDDTHDFTGVVDVSEYITTPDIKLTGLSNAGVDTDKFLVLDTSNNVDFRTGAEVLSDIGATAPQSLQDVTDNGASTTNVIQFPNFTLNTPTNNNAASDKILVLDGSNRSKIRTRDELTADLGLDYIVTPLQLVVDTKNLSSGYVSWFGVSDLQPNADRGYTTWIAPTAGYIEKIIISPEQSNTTTANIDLGLYVGGSQQSSDVTVAMGAAGTNKTFTFGSTNYSFTAGERLSIALDKNTNTADLYNVMVIIRLSN